jgi:hypothetical protein
VTAQHLPFEDDLKAHKLQANVLNNRPTSVQAQSNLVEVSLELSLVQGQFSGQT